MEDEPETVESSAPPTLAGGTYRQLDELGTELSAVTDQEPVDVAGIVNGALDEIRNSQTRLANEQARYQSAFRTDIAVLIEQLRQ